MTHLHKWRNLKSEQLSSTSEFKRGRESVEDDGRSGHPKDATVDKNVKVVHTLVMCDRRRDLRSIASQVGISLGAVNQS